MNRYVVTVLLTAAAAGSCLALAGAFGLRPPSFVVLFVAAAFASAWYGGFRAGLLSTTLGTIALILLLTKPEYSLRIDRPDEQVALLAFLIISLVGNWLCSIAHAERPRLHFARSVP